MSESIHQKFMNRAIELSRFGASQGHGGPFGAIIVKNGEIIAEGFNRVTSSLDPTAHAEIVAIREACNKINDFQLTGCTLYTSCEPCPMCLGAIYWARPEKVYFANTRFEAADAGFDDAFIYDEIQQSAHLRQIPMVHFPDEKAKNVFEEWKINPQKIPY